MRILKDPDVRRAEILDTAEALFAAKGYAKTTVMDMLNAIGIAKGTFYYYFKSKEEVMDAVIERMTASDAAQAAGIAADPDLSPVEKFHRVLLAQKAGPESGKTRMIEQFRHPRNAEMHQRSLVLSVRSLAPILGRIVREGIAQGVFDTPFPDETVEFLLVSGQVVLDDAVFDWTPEERSVRLAAFVGLVESALGAAPGCFAFLPALLGEA